MSRLGLSIRIPRESLIKLSALQSQQIVVKFSSGQQLHGVLKSWDNSMNLVLDEVKEILSSPNQQGPGTREIGLVIVKGQQISSICLKDGYQIISNPYQAEGVGEGEQGEQQVEQEQAEDK